MIKFKKPQQTLAILCICSHLPIGANAQDTTNGMVNDDTG